MTICNLLELRKIGRLQKGDVIYFGTMEYVVCSCFLGGKYVANDEILSGIDNKKQFCSEAYGYRIAPYIDMDGRFPQYNMEDYAAAYRVAEKIYIDILGQCTRPKHIGNQPIKFVNGEGNRMKENNLSTGASITSTSFSRLNGISDDIGTFSSPHRTITNAGTGIIANSGTSTSIDPISHPPKKKRPTRFKIQRFLNEKY